MDKDARGADIYLKMRAEAYLKRWRRPNPAGVGQLPLAACVRGIDFVLMGRKCGGLLARIKDAGRGSSWPIGYATRFRGYIPSGRVVKKAVYEAESSLI